MRLEEKYEIEYHYDEDGNKICIFGCGKILDDWDYENSCRSCE